MTGKNLDYLLKGGSVKGPSPERRGAMSEALRGGDGSSSSPRETPAKGPFYNVRVRPGSRAFDVPKGIRFLLDLVSRQGSWAMTG